MDKLVLIIIIILIVILLLVFSSGLAFKKIVILFSLIILLTSLIFIGYTLQNNKYNKKFPPVVAECPDYWKATNDKCYNSKNLGICRGSTDFNTSKYQGENGDCEKFKWAQGCNVSWSGITNNSNVCD